MTSHLREFSSKKELLPVKLSPEEIFSVYYHNIFEYPLVFTELIKWRANNVPNLNMEVDYKNGHYFLKGCEGLVYKRILRERISQKKRLIAKRACEILSILPSIRMIGITGSLAMSNAKKDSDIDLIIITKHGKLWSTRLAAYILLKLTNISIRKPGEINQKDKLCLNIWLDESDVAWPKKDQNVYTAHEILHIIPILNRMNTHEKFLYKNKWALRYWPNVLKINLKDDRLEYSKHMNLSFFELIFYNIQRYYLKSKLTNECVSFTRAVFHPRNLGQEIMKKIYLTQKV